MIVQKLQRNGQPRPASKLVRLLAAPGQKLAITRETDRLILTVPKNAPDATASVVVLQIDGEPVVPPLPTVGAKATASAAMPGNDAANAFDGTAAKRWRAPAATANRGGGA